MKRLLSYTTSAGIFYIATDENRQYHPIFNDIDLGTYQNMWEAVRDLTLNDTNLVVHPETQENIDTSTLGIPEDYLGWVRM